VELLHRGAVTVEQFQHGAEGRDLGEFRLGFDQRRHALQAIHHLRIHRMLHPQRAVLIKCGNALLGRYELRAALGCSHPDEFYDGLLCRAVVPRGERVGSLPVDGGESHRANKRGSE
jgi:hypothetical protein